MGTINPPAELADPDNQFRLEYIQDKASQLNFDYPPVRRIVFWISGLQRTTASELILEWGRRGETRRAESGGWGSRGGDSQPLPTN